MSGVKTHFLTGAVAKIKINNRTIAYCSDVTYTVSVSHVAPIVLGMYEGSSVEPLSYKVSGTFSVIRSVADVQGGELGGRGNGVGSYGANSKLGKLIDNFKVFSGGDGRPYDNFDPSALHFGTSFVIEVYQKIPGAELMPVAKLKNCRLKQLDFSLTKRGTAVERYQFIALYADEDSFLANPSGQGQQYAQ